jgi:hypothetical protein
MQLPPLRQSFGVLKCGLEIVAMFDQLRAERPDCFILFAAVAMRHDNDRMQPGARRHEGHALAVIAAGPGDHSGAHRATRPYRPMRPRTLKAPTGVLQQICGVGGITVWINAAVRSKSSSVGNVSSGFSITRPPGGL